MPLWLKCLSPLQGSLITPKKIFRNMYPAVTVSTSPERAAYDRALKFMTQNGWKAKDFICHQKELFVAQSITGATSYNFNLFEVKGLDNPRELKLNRNDAFFCYGIALNLCLVDTVTPVPFSNSALQTWNDPAIFAGAGQAVALESFYNSVLTFKTKPNERVVDFSTSQLKFNPGAADIGKFGPNPNHQGFFHLSGEVIISGQEDNSLVLTVNSDAVLTGAVAADQEVYLCIRLLGHQVANGAKTVTQFFGGA